MTCRPTTIRCTVTERVTLRVCAPQRVQPPALIGRAVCRGASSVTARGVCVRAGRAVCAGTSSVTARASGVFAGHSVVSGAATVQAGAQVAHNMEEIIRIFGESSIEILLASDGAGGLMDYVTPGSPTVVDDNIGNIATASLAESFYSPGMDILAATGARDYNGGTPLKTYSLGLFCNDDGSQTTPIAFVNKTYLYFATSGRIMIRDAVAGVNNYSPTSFANYEQNEFMVWSADEAAGEMRLQASGGTHVINSYPADMTDDRIRLIHQSGNGGKAYQAQFFILLNRLMTDPEIAQVRALL